jgi:hypothetical protein
MFVAQTILFADAGDALPLGSREQDTTARKAG